MIFYCSYTLSWCICISQTYLFSLIVILKMLNKPAATFIKWETIAKHKQAKKQKCWCTPWSKWWRDGGGRLEGLFPYNVWKLNFPLYPTPCIVSLTMCLFFNEKLSKCIPLEETKNLLFHCECEKTFCKHKKKHHTMWRCFSL